MTKVPISGGCLCGAVRYEAGEAPLRTAYCHCRMCQKAGGAPFAVGVFFRSEAFRITRGKAKFYRSSDFAERGFCETCGSRLIYRAVGDPVVSVEVGSLDRPGDVTPEYHTGVESRVPWLAVDDDLPRLRTGDDPESHAVKAAAEGRDE